MRNILFVAVLLVFVGCAFSATFTIGNNIFYASVLMTNAAYGSGAAFPCDVWFNGNLGLMRVDYRNPTTNAVFMSIFYNYTSHDKYEVCGTTCARATWNAQMPVFNGNQNTYNSPSACVTPDWPGPRACVSNCNTYVANPAQPQGISSLSYNDTGSALCLVRWSVQSGQTYGPEWHVKNYYTSNYPNGVSSPGSASTYSSVISGVSCPQPSCYTVLDLAIIVDESGSICNPNSPRDPCYWPDVQNFVLGLISTFDMAPDRVRVGLAYFSGLGDCRYNWTGTTAVRNYNCKSSPDGYTCPDCGGRWNTITNGGLTTDKSGLYKSAYDHAIQAGFTCISCGLDVGIKLLNIAPKANVQKLIILFTDGAQNMVTNTLKYEGDLAKSMGIKVIAVATGAYKLSDLQVFTSDIYTSTTYSGLSSLINSITAPLCQPLSNIDTCDFCSGLCSCTTTCNCPNCDDYNACTNQNCDIRPPPDGTLGVCTYTNITCNDNDVCTVDKCNPSSGCDFSTQVAAPTGPPTNNYCNRWVCTNPSGYQFSDVGSGLCPQGANLCNINYCNTTVGTDSQTGLKGSCVTKNLSSDIPYGTTYVYTTSSGQTFTAQGCARPSNALPCYTYTCNPVDGSCSRSTSACKCQVDSDCDDKDGCTVDVCDTNLNQCNNTRRDCWSELSNGVCKQGQTGSINTTTGDLYWTSGIGSFPLNNGLPVTGNYACDRLACYGGKRSTYTCLSTSSSSYQCQRQTVDCTSTGCVDKVCRSLGTWTSGQYNTDCGNQKTRTCDDGNKCTTDSCKSTFTGTACTNATCPTDNTRCNFVSITCDDNNACTQNLCVPSTGCDFTQPIATPSPTTCFNWACDTSKGNVRTVKSNACLNSNKCMTSYCNTTQDTCVTWDKSTHFTNEFTTFVDQNGFLQTYSGCLNTTALSKSCLSAKCNQTTGACYIDTTSCGCTNVIDCDDNNGCTMDSCDGNGKCQYQDVDCWSEMSNGGCHLNDPVTTDNSTGWTNYNQGSPNNAFSVPTDPNNYNCPTMACFSGKRSQYVCASTSSSQHTCSRVTTDCSKGGCQDTICRSLATWSNNQLDTDCVTAYVPDCSSNKCYAKSCNTGFSYVYAASGQNNGNTPNLGEYRCNVAYNGTTCVDNNLCTVDQLCVNATGCDFSTQTTNPFTPNNCFSDTCDPNSGWFRTNIGSTVCSSSNLCIPQYCNTSLTDQNGKAGTCAFIDKTLFPVGTTQFYVDSDGLTKSVTGCSNPNANDFACRKFDCEPNTGLCTVNIDACECLKDADCEDGSGCTIDKCVGIGKCQRTYIDCYSYFSNGKCLQGTTQLSYENSTGLTLYDEYLRNQFTNSPVYSQVDSNGNPSPATGVDRTCGQLSCYNGAPSNYSCFSTQEGTFTCQRSYLNCSRNGCQDNVCQSLGTWNANNQSDSNCGAVITPSCADNNACTSDYCDIAWTPQSSTPRCRHDSLNGTNYCDDGNFCTDDYCDQQDTSGNVCKHRLYADWYVRKYICKKAKVCQTVQCTVNKCIYGYIGCTAPTLCVFFTCNSSTNGTCKSYPTGVYKIDGCGVCGGNGLSCVPTKPVNQKKASIAVALGVGLGVGLFFAFIIIGIITKKSYDSYLALGTETLGTVTTSPTYQGAEHHLDTGDYHRGSK